MDKRVLMIDSDYNLRKNVVGKFGNIEYPNQTIGTLVKTDDGTWLYYFKGKEEFLYCGAMIIEPIEITAEQDQLWY